MQKHTCVDEVIGAFLPTAGACRRVAFGAALVARLRQWIKREGD
jgi:hypothetical protein